MSKYQVRVTDHRLLGLLDLNPTAEEEWRVEYCGKGTSIRQYTRLIRQLFTHYASSDSLDGLMVSTQDADESFHAITSVSINGDFDEQLGTIEWLGPMDLVQRKTTINKPTYHSDQILGYPDGYITSDQPPFTVHSDRGDQPPGNKALQNEWFEIKPQAVINDGYYGIECQTLWYNVHPKTTLSIRQCAGQQPAEFAEGYGVRWKQNYDPRDE